MANKMFAVNVKENAPWASSPAFIRAGSNKEAIRIYMEMTGISFEGDLSPEDINCKSFPDCPINFTKNLYDSDLKNHPIFKDLKKEK